MKPRDYYNRMQGLGQGHEHVCTCDKSVVSWHTCTYISIRCDKSHQGKEGIIKSKQNTMLLIRVSAALTTGPAARANNTKTTTAFRLDSMPEYHLCHMYRHVHDLDLVLCSITTSLQSYSHMYDIGIVRLTA